MALSITDNPFCGQPGNSKGTIDDIDEATMKRKDRKQHRYLYREDYVRDIDKSFALTPLNRGRSSSSAKKPKHIWGTEEKDRIRGTNGVDKIWAFGGSDVIKGRGGDDYIDPGVWTTGKFDKVKGGKGSDTFVINKDYFAFIMDFDLIEDKLDLSGLGESFRWGVVGRRTYIYGEFDFEVAIFKGKLDLSEANIV